MLGCGIRAFSARRLCLAFVRRVPVSPEEGEAVCRAKSVRRRSVSVVIVVVVGDGMEGDGEDAVGSVVEGDPEGGGVDEISMLLWKVG